MAHSLECSSESIATASDPNLGRVGSERPSRFNQTAAAVGIVAGVVFIRGGGLLFSEFLLCSNCSRAKVMRCEMGGSSMDGMSLAGGMPGMVPMGPGQLPSTSAPSTLRSPRP